MIDRRLAGSRRAPLALRLDTSLEQLLDRLDAALATIVDTVGSTYRKAGARMLIEADGRLTGLLSGGCFEHDLREHALRVLKSGCATRLSYDTRGDDDPRSAFAFTDIAGEGRILIAACAAHESVWEQPGTGHGLLTAAVVGAWTDAHAAVSFPEIAGEIIRLTRVEAERTTPP